MRDPILERRYAGQALMDVETLARFPVALDAFTERDVRHVVETVASMRDAGESLNEQTLELALTRKGYVREATQDVWAWVSACSDVGAVANRLRELMELRLIHEKLAAALRACEDGDSGVVREQLRELLDMRPKGLSEHRVMDAYKVADHTIKRMRETGATAIKLWPSIDRVYRLTPGHVMVLGASTNTGKSSAISAWAYANGIRKIPVGVISVEDPTEDWGAKWIGHGAGISPALLWSGNYADHMDAIRKSIARFAESNVVFSDVYDRSLDAVLSDMAHMKHAHGVKAIFLDYLQAISLPPGTRDMRTGTDYVLGQLIAQAGRLGVALVIACQLSRPPKDKAWREPSKYDLKESGSIENRAQCIVMMWSEPSEGDTADKVFAKIEKVKRVAFNRAKFEITRDRVTGHMWELDLGAMPGDEEFGGDR